MCITNIYVDRYPDGREVEVRQLSNCQYGSQSRPCRTHSTVENPVRNIQFGETPGLNLPNYPIFPASPPLSSTSSGEYRKQSRSRSRSDDGYPRPKRSSLRTSRLHPQERILVVNAPPTPTTPPQMFPNSSTAPPSPDPRARPIIVDERPFYRNKSPSRRPKAPASWDSPSTSHTSFDLQAEREREKEERAAERRQQAKARRRRDEREAMDKERLIAEANEDINRRAAIPIPIAIPSSRQRTHIRPVIDQSTKALQERMGGLTLSGRTGGLPPVVTTSMTYDEAMTQRLRERQLPNRRSSVGVGERRPRFLYDPGMYRWE